MGACAGCREMGRRMKGRRPGRRGRGSVRMKVRRLRKLVPGGRGMRPDHLFLRTADYILQLRSQLTVLRALDSFCRP